MSTSPAFEWLCAELPKCTTLSPLQARGTVRLMLGNAGLDAHSLRKDQLFVLIERQLPIELTKRRIPHSATLGTELADLLRRTPINESAQPDTPEAVFSRLGRS